MARPVFIIDGSRTPFLKARSGPGPFTPVDLAVQCGRPLLARQPFSPTAFDQVILGCVNVIADEMNPARVAALRLGMGEAMVAFTVQINCGSGMQSIDTGYRYIREGVSDLILAGAFNKQVFSTFTGRATPTETTKEKKITAAVDAYESDFGKLKIVPDRFQRPRDVLVLETDKWAIAYLNGRKFVSLYIAPTGDSEKREILSEYTLVARNEKSSGGVFDLTTA